MNLYSLKVNKNFIKKKVLRMNHKDVQNAEKLEKLKEEIILITNL